MPRPIEKARKDGGYARALGEAEKTEGQSFMDIDLVSKMCII